MEQDTQSSDWCMEVTGQWLPDWTARSRRAGLACPGLNLAHLATN